MTKEKKKVTPESLGKVVLLAGGFSSERDVSLMSGKGVYDALVEAGVDVTRFDPQDQSLGELEQGHFDRAVISLHGRFGEDGTIQGVLEYLGVPYTGPGVKTSAITIDKALTKQVWNANGIPTPQGMVVTKGDDMAFVIQSLGKDLVVKPAREGSSIGLSKLKNATVEELEKAVVKAAALDPRVLVEEYIIGRELTVAVLGQAETSHALPIIEIVAPEGNYDYQNKYFTNDVRYECPANLPEELAGEIAKMCERAYRVLEARGWSRIDVMLRDDGRFALLEINTSPGMTSHSLVPLAAKNAGMSYGELVMEVASTAALDNKR
ncbi:MAG: D-alanine--D-alanine ligase [Burkholderiaceae bacterium]|nr:D-alanine--D-alanine ligase [Burkholderiaceae bacterium]